MNDRNVMVLGGMVGALVGVSVGFAFFTERGRQLRADLGPEIETVIREAMRLTQAVDEFRSGRPAAQLGAATGTATWPRRTP